ncbi:blue-light photoreceptor [mine drainage metagenome]|uniref:Blue-light photoreceptor n=1 Tax=mine drainage metagenome TaxID=410659 RepID=A0A1J5QZ60_9ZZZZ
MSGYLTALQRLPRSRVGLWTLLLFPLVVVLGMFVENSHQRNLRTEQMVAARARTIAQYEAALIAQRLNNQFVDLQFSGLALIGRDADPSHPTPNVVRSLRTFIRLHPHLYAIDILSANGNRILWSTQPQASHPITNGSAFTPIAGQPDFFLGQDRFAARAAQTGASGHVLTMRVRIADAQGNTQYFVESPYRLEELLANPALRNTPWSLRIIDPRDHSLLGTVDALGVRFPTRTASVQPGRSVRVAVHGVPPLQVEASWTPQAAQALGMPARTPWGLLFALIASMLVAAWAIDTLLRRSERQVSRLSEQSRELEQSRVQLEHVAAFQAMIADVNQAIAQAQDEPVLLQQLCDIAVERGQLALALIARPDVQGRFQFLAAAGQVAYLEGLVISSRPDIPEGNGPAGTAFRQNRALFNSDYSSDALSPWRQAANALSLQASAALPIVRDGQVWGILSVYKRGEAVFDSSLQALLRELALDIGRGLERVEQMRQLLSLRAAMDSASDGVTISDIDGIVLYVNPAFTQITGYPPEEVLGRNHDFLHAPDTAPSTVADIARAVQQGTFFSGEILNIRKDGTTFWNFLRIAPVRDVHGRPKAFIGFQRDITANVEQAEHLNRLKRLYQALSVEGDVLLQARSAQETLAAAQVEAPFDPFDDEVRQLLRTLAPIVQSIVPDFTTEFYAQILQDPGQAEILSALSPQEYAHLQQQQAQHLQFLLHPDTTAEQIKERAQRLGQAHALVGLSIAALLQATSLYESLLRSQLERSALMAQTRYRLLRIIQARLQCDLQGEITAQQDLLSTYHALLAHPLPLHGRWSDLAQGELDRLASLPGIRGAFIFRVNETGQLRIEFAAGTVAAQVQAEINAQGLHPTIHAGADGRRGPMGQAWASGLPQVVESYLLDKRLQPWHAMAQLLGVRSATAIPLQRGTAVEAVLFILGAYPHRKRPAITYGTRLDDGADRVFAVQADAAVEVAVGAAQRCGSSSCNRLFGQVGSRVSTSLR